MNIEQQRRQIIVSIETLRYGKLFVLLSLLPLLLILYHSQKKTNTKLFCVVCAFVCVWVYVCVGVCNLLAVMRTLTLELFSGCDFGFSSYYGLLYFRIKDLKGFCFHLVSVHTR